MLPEIAAIACHSLKTANMIQDKCLSRTTALVEEAFEKFENAPATDL